MTTTTEIIESSTDLAWFPLKPCTRCGGSGQYTVKVQKARKVVMAIMGRMS